MKALDGETTDAIGFKMVTHREFSSEWFTKSMAAMGRQNENHRKQWELAYVLHVVTAKRLCQKGKRGLVFAVGKEILPQIFASLGCDIVATDIAVDDNPNVAAGWIAGNQHAASLSALYTKGYKGVTWEDMQRRVSFRPENMLRFSPWLQAERFDFVWSLCAIEHVGSIAGGQSTVLQSLDLLKPGGVAIHTVEFNLASNTLTKLRSDESVWRMQDVDTMRLAAINKGFVVPTRSWGAGHTHLDRTPDVCQDTGQRYRGLPGGHVKLECDDLIKTSYAMVFEKP
eukprot:m.71121 g.71121  ORF g.71121 m.71121 type:complete len:284 (-) comp18603_c0_seq2:17-868(-)